MSSGALGIVYVTAGGVFAGGSPAPRPRKVEKEAPPRAVLARALPADQLISGERAGTAPPRRGTPSAGSAAATRGRRRRRDGSRGAGRGPRPGRGRRGCGSAGRIPAGTSGSPRAGRPP